MNRFQTLLALVSSLTCKCPFIEKELIKDFTAYLKILKSVHSGKALPLVA